MPETHDRYELLYREYYWAPAYKSYDVEGLTRRKICDRKTDKLIAHADVTSIGYSWEAEEDYSKETPFYSLIPSKQLYDGMKMQLADKDGVFLNEEGDEVCFDAKAIEQRSKNYLLVRKDALLDYLKTNHKKIMWYVLGEKNIIGIHNYQSVPKLPMWLVVSGTYTLDKTGKVVGSLRTCHEI